MIFHIYASTVVTRSFRPSRTYIDRSRKGPSLLGCSPDNNAFEFTINHHHHPLLQQWWTSDDYHCFYPKPLGSGGGVAKHLKLDIGILVLVRQELVLKYFCMKHLYQCEKKEITLALLLNLLILSILVSGKTWTSSGNLGPPNPLGMSGFASSGLIFTGSRYHRVASISGNTLLGWPTQLSGRHLLVINFCPINLFCILKECDTMETIIDMWWYMLFGRLPQPGISQMSE